jgi:hypothetical protein
MRVVSIIKRCRGEISGAEVEGHTFHHRDIAARICLPYMTGVVQLVEVGMVILHALGEAHLAAPSSTGAYAVNHGAYILVARRHATDCVLRCMRSHIHIRYLISES